MTAPVALLDAASLWFRAYFGVPDSLRAPDGSPVNAVRGFTDMVAYILTERRPRRLVACLDANWRPEFRVAALPTYKAHRVADEEANAEEVPDTLTPQIPIIMDVLDAAGLCSAEAAGLEADDVIGTLTARETSDPVEVVTGDRDLFQLVRDRPTPARVLYLGRGLAKAELLGPVEVASKYAVPLDRAGAAYAEMAVLRGDPSDGLPGVAGIGEKTAAKLITEFGSLDAVLAGAAAGDKRITPRLREKLADAADYLAVAPTVVQVVTDADIVTDRADDHVPATPADPDRLTDLQTRWNLGGSIDRLRAALTP